MWRRSSSLFSIIVWYFVLLLTLGETASFLTVPLKLKLRHIGHHNEVDQFNMQKTTTTIASDGAQSIEIPKGALPDKIQQQSQARRHRDQAYRISRSFDVRPFRPASNLLSNRHVQTISGALLRDDSHCHYVHTAEEGRVFPKWIDPGYAILASAISRKLQQRLSLPVSEPTAVPFQYDNRERFETPDQDFFHVDFKYNDTAGTVSPKGTVIVVHGLQSNSHSNLVQEMAHSFLSRGLDVAAINFRGCSGEPNRGLRAYHLGFTDDLKQLIGILSRRLQETADVHGSRKSVPPIFLCGKSLGANVVLKALGELGDSVDTYNIQGAAVHCCPFDNERNSKFFQRGFSKAVYNAKLLQSLKSMALAQLQQFESSQEAQLVDMELLRNCTTIAEFDEAFTAPLFDFENHLDYYNQTSCLNFLDKICVPTLIYNSRDDPFMDPVHYPWDFHCYSLAGERKKTPIRVVRSDHGGHLGYMFHDSGGDTSVVEGTVSFMPTEMGRFIDHVLSSTIAEDNSSPSDDEMGTTVQPILETEPSDLSSIRREAFSIASSFRPNDFNPPQWFRNEHFQTISGVFLRHDPSCRYVTGGSGVNAVIQKSVRLISAISQESDVFGDFWDSRQRIDTPDGDFFHVDYKYHTSNDMVDPSSKGMVVIVHGLQSSSNSSLSVDLGQAFSNQGFDVACINFRGCSGVPNNGLRAYHLGFVDDLIFFLRILNEQELKPPPIFLSGFSLGANVVLKALGELGSRAFTDYGIYGAAVAGAPFDNERNIPFVQKTGFNKLAYNDSLLKSLKKTGLSQLDRYSDTKETESLSYSEIAASTKISSLESALIAPIFGFRDNVDYYRKTNCINAIDHIVVPTFILNAADDPFFDPSIFPWEKNCDSPTGRESMSPIKLVRSKYGGHLGFMFHQKREGETHQRPVEQEVSFMPDELARFISHVYARRNTVEGLRGAKR